MDLQYIQNCPTCGAPIELTEADRLIQCPFCDVKNYMVVGGPLRFVLPDKSPEHVSCEDIIYFPYLRFKGHIYSCLGGELQYKIVDTTHQGVATPRIPASLGLRPQTMQLSLAAPDGGGRFVKISEKLSAIFSRAALLSSLSNDRKAAVYHRSFIGETISFIYLPAYIKEDSLFDAVLNRQIAQLQSLDSLIKKSQQFKKEWLPRFISTVCPHCAELMSGSRDSLVLTCRNCHSCWEEESGRFARLKYSVVSPVKKSTVFLPFWKITTEAEGVEMKSFGDFLRLTNQPVVVRPDHDRMECNLFVPAFKIRPKHFLNFAKNLTVSQARLPAGSQEIKSNLFPVTLPLVEAVQALKAILSYSVMNKRKFLPKLPSMMFHQKEVELLYLPFNSVGHDLVQDHTMVTVARSVLGFGRTM